jgi:drug/metabolite transporter (DMT)-like permease
MQRLGRLGGSHVTVLDGKSAELGLKARLLRLCLVLLGILAFVAVAVAMENEFGIPFKTTYRIACAIACLAFMYRIGSEYPGEQWPRIAFIIALAFNLGLFFSPLAHLPASKGDLLFSGAPDAAILLAARTASYPATDAHQRAVRQQLILGLILALAFCALILSIMFIPDRAAH